MEDCWLEIGGTAAVALMALASGAGNLEAYLGLPANCWIIGGAGVVALWTYERPRKACVLGCAAAWMMLIAGGVVGVLPQLIDARIPGEAQAFGAYASACGLLLFLVSYCLMRADPVRRLRPPPPAASARRRDRARG